MSETTKSTQCNLVKVQCCNTDNLRNRLNAALEKMAEENNIAATYDHVTFTGLIDPDSNFAGLINDEIVTTISACNYDDRFSFIGSFLTLKAYQRQGCGRKIFEACLEHAGDRVIGMYSVEHMVDWYKAYGFEQTTTTNTYRLYPGKKPAVLGHQDDAHIAAVSEVDFDDLCHFDRKYFPAERRAFLKAWLNHPKITSALAYVEDGKILGYGAIRKCVGDKVCKVGPLLADSFDVAERLGRALLYGLPDGIELVQYERITANVQAGVLAEKLGFDATPFGGAVMYKNGRPDFDVSGVYSYTSGAYG